MGPQTPLELTRQSNHIDVVPTIAACGKNACPQRQDWSRGQAPALQFSDELIRLIKRKTAVRPGGKLISFKTSETLSSAANSTASLTSNWL